MRMRDMHLQRRDGIYQKGMKEMNTLSSCRVVRHLAKDRLLSFRMADDRWKMTWSDVPVVPSDGRKKGFQMRLNSAPVYRFLMLYGVTDLLVYVVTLLMSTFQNICKMDFTA
ncbi:hypothetical protein Tco_1555224 [Tanacetum coccineum]